MSDEQGEQLTQDAYDKLTEELKRRSTTLRQEITDRIEVARGHGDLKENAEYHAAKDEQGLNEDRIRGIQARLRDAEIIEVDTSSGVVGVGMIVTVDDDGDVDEYFVGSMEDQASDGVEIVSALSPMGQALIGTKVGETTTYTGPTGTAFSLKVTALRAP